MVRPNQQLHPSRDYVEAKPAATVLLLRDGPQGLEVLMTRRSLKASFAPGAYVFPGGGVDALDAQSHVQARRRAGQSDAHLTESIAAIRESFEELGILMARRADGSPVDASDIAQLDRKAPFLAQCQARGLMLSADEVFVLAHWTTDRDLPRRFEVPFLVARMPEGQTPVADESEQFDPVWVSPADALARHKAGDFFIIFPTIRTLERLQAWATVQDVLGACAASEEPLWTSCPRGAWLAGREVRYMETDAPFGELALVCPDGQLLHHLDWEHEAPRQLLKNVARLTCGNPSFMTGPGTNSYIVGDAQTGFLVIDPGPEDAAHQDRLWRACGGDIRAIICTHSHADHSPGARPLQALCMERGAPHGVPAIYGLKSLPTARPNSHFTPDKTLSHSERITLTHEGPQGTTTHTLLAVHTPGHAANHVCLALIEDGLLFSGDHILNGSTTVIDPPDGNMTHYLESLDALSEVCAEHHVEFILPAHGYVLGNAPAQIAHLKAHRLKREAKIMGVMQAHPEGTIDDWLALAYDDVPERVWPVAKRSLLAHLERLQNL